MKLSFPDVRMSVRASVSAGLAVFAAQLAQLEYPIYAMIAAVLVTDLATSQTRELAVPRLVGTILGAGMGAAISVVLPHGVIAVCFGIIVTMLLSYVAGLHDASKVAGYICGIVLLSYGDNPWFYAFHRFLETVLGIGMAVMVSFVPRLVTLPGERSK